MITNSFVFLRGVGYKKEENLWKQGILSWEDFINISDIKGMAYNQKIRYDNELERAKISVLDEDSTYFLRNLRPRDQWRLYDDFKDRACFLDIETTGLGSKSDITMVGIFDGKKVKSFIKDINLSHENLDKELSKHKLLLTFYGTSFDIPFIRQKFSNLSIDIPHIDLCFTSRRIGLRGGLKAIEREIGINRGDEICGIDGFEAVRLWNRWEKRNDTAALETLVEYNSADVINLKSLAEITYKKLKEKTLISAAS